VAAAVTGECEVCGVPVGVLGTCEIPGCPAYGTRAGSAEMDAAAERWRSRPSVAQARTMTGTDALSHLERRMWIDMWGAVIEVEHRYGS
jgi:hypothetical protein